MKTLLLASTSPYRKELLLRLGIDFHVAKPRIDEEAEKDPRLRPQALAEKLAELKARSLTPSPHIVLGGDQLVSFEGQVLGKPGHRERAIEQLEMMNGKSHELITSIFVVDGERGLWHTDRTRLTMKLLSRSQIENVVDRDQPFDCAGSYKIEKHGISLIERIESEDFTAIQGLPLLALSRMLKECGMMVPAERR